MTRNIFIVSDTHFGHANILKFLNEDNSHVRSFDDVNQMNEILVDNWNKTVRDEDIVYHLGDVYFGDGHQVLPRLRGRKRLILGNHDNGKSPHLLNSFQKILVWRMFPEFNCLLTHVPVHKSALHKVHYNLHGHVHRSSLNEEQYVNCCVEVNEYRPKAIEELLPA